MNATGIFAAVAAATDRSGAPVLITSDRAWSGVELLAAAENLSEVLARHAPGGVLFCELVDPVSVTLCTLAADRAGIFVVHRDPTTSGTDGPVPGPLVRDRADAPEPGWVQWIDASGSATLAIGPAPVDGPQVADGLPPGGQIFLTSGSTGVPTGVVRPAAAVLADARRVAEFLGYTPDAPVVCAAPLFHVYGFNYGLIAPLVSGSPVRVLPSRSLPSQCATAVRELDARTLIALPAHYGLLATGPANAAAARGLARLRSGVSAGAPLPPALLERGDEALSFPLYNCYGSSEAGAVTLSRVIAGQQAGDIGEPLSGVRARIDDGELWLHTSSLALGRTGPGLLDGFTPLADADGWYRTGDLAERPDPGARRLRLLGRSATVINVAGEKVSPTEIERLIAQCEGVLDVHVSAEPDPTRGQVPTARVVLRPDVAERDLVEWCRARLSPPQMPRRIEAVERIPRSATGKPLAEPTVRKP